MRRHRFAGLAMLLAIAVVSASGFTLAGGDRIQSDPEAKRATSVDTIRQNVDTSRHCIAHADRDHGMGPEHSASLHATRPNHSAADHATRHGSMDHAIATHDSTHGEMGGAAHECMQHGTDHGTAEHAMMQRSQTGTALPRKGGQTRGGHSR